MAITPPRPVQRVDDVFQLILWFWANTFPISYISEKTGLSTRTVAGYLRHLRIQIEESAPPYTGVLDGVVHVEAWNYKPRLKLPPPNRSSLPKKRPLLLGMMSAEGSLRLFVISSRSNTEIHPLVKAHVARGTSLIINHSNVYRGLRTDGFPDQVQKSTRSSSGIWRLEGGSTFITSGIT